MKGNRLLAVLLAGALQLAPVARTFISFEARVWAPSSWAWICQVGAGVAALLGSYDAVSGATQIVAPYAVNATVGTPYSRQLTTSGQTAHSWSANTAPLGTPVFPLTPGLWLTNANGKIGGTPTKAGTSNITISAWQNSGNSGASVSAVFVFTVTNSAPSGTPPTITTQPRSQTNYVGSAVTFTVAATGTAPLGYQWRFQGAAIASATATNYTLASAQLADAGNYSVVVTNSAGSVTSANAGLTVLAPSADLIAAVNGPPTASPGAALTCQVSVTNLGPTSASNVVVSDALPVNATFVSASGGGTVSGGSVRWPAISSMPVGGTASFTVTMTAPNDGSVTNTATATSDVADPNTGNNNGTAATSRFVTSIAPQADVIVTVTGPASVNAGANLSYLVQVTNLGPSVASNLVVSDTLPSGASFVSATGGGMANAGVVTWPAIPSLALNQGTMFTVTAKAPAAGTLTNKVSSTCSTPDPSAGNNNGSAPSAMVTSSVQPVADLAVLASGPSAVMAGGSISYLVTVTNLGPSTASNITVTDLLPTGTAFVSVTGGASVNGGVVTWPVIASLASSASMTFGLTVNAPASGSLTNRASCNSPTTDPFAANNDGSDAASAVTTEIGQLADLAVLVLGPTTVLPGSSLTYTITVTNLGPTEATNVIVSDVLPAGITFVSSTGGAVPSAGVVAWPAINSLAPASSASFDITVTSPLSGTISNSASATSGTSDPNLANNNGTAAASRWVLSVTPQADLAVESAGPATVLAGSTFNYTVVVTNLGPSTASNIVAQDILPPTVSFVSATGGGVASAGVVTWPMISTLGNGGGTSFSVTVKAPGDGTLTNHASSTSPTFDPVTVNHNGSAAAAKVITTVQPQADLAVRVSGPATILPGGSLTYSITLSNQGPSAASNVVVTDLLPPGTVFVSATGGGVTNAGVVTWPSIASLPSGSTASFGLTLTASSAGTLTNRVSCTSDTPDPAAGNNDGTSPGSTALTTVQAQADIVVTATAPALVLPGDTIIYRIGVTNLGPSPASNVVVSDKIPINAALVSAPGANVSNNVATWPTIASLASGATASYTLTVTAPASGTLTNVAFAVSGTLDPLSTNNDGSQWPSKTTTAIASEQFGIGADAIALNPQTGLFEQLARVTNTGPATIAAFRLYVGGLRTGVQLYNATGTNAGQPYVQYNAALNPGQAVALRLEFFVPDRQAFTDTLSAEAVLPSNTGTAGGGGVSVNRVFVDTHTGAAPRFVIEFPTTPGRVYTILYTENLSGTWKVATPSITAAATITQWYDDGPPKTDGSPLTTGGSRLYQILLNP